MHYLHGCRVVRCQARMLAPFAVTSRFASGQLSQVPEAFVLFRKLTGARLARSKVSIDGRQGLCAQLVLQIQLQLVVKNMLGLLGSGHQDWSVIYSCRTL